MTRRKDPEERQSRPSSCVGCGQAAAGYNYDAPSCFSCKTFFRRTVISKQDNDFRGCMKSGLCATDNTVRQCRVCRFEKLVKGGMKASLISNGDGEPPSSSISGTSSSQELVIRAEKTTPESNPELRLVANPSRFESKVEMMIQNLLTIEAAHQMLRTSSCAPKLSSTLTMDEFVAGPSKLGYKFEVICAQPDKTFPINVFPFEMLIKQRVGVHSGFDHYHARKKYWFYYDTVYSVEFIKALPIYNKMNFKSKRILLSSALTCANITAAFYSYAHRSDRTLYPDGAIRTWNSLMLEYLPGSIHQHTAVIAAMKSADLNAHEYTLLKMIVVCNPMIEGLAPEDVTLLSLERKRCNNALLSYVLARRGVNEGPAFFTKIMSIANLVMHLTSWEKGQHILVSALGLYDTPMPFREAIFHSD